MAHGTVQVKHKQEDTHGVLAWVVVFAAALYFFFEFIQMNMFNALDHSLMLVFHTDAVGLGKLSANYFYGNILFLFIAGMVLDRFSTKRLILTAMAVSIICVFCFSGATHLWQAQVARFVTGLAAAFCFLSCVRLASRWFPPKRMALAIGGVVTFAMLGGLVAQTPMTLLANDYGWRMALRIDGIFGIFLFIIIILCVRDYPMGGRKAFHDEEAAVRGDKLSHVIARVLGRLQNWLGGLYTSLMNLPVMLLGGIWGVPYLIHVRHLSAVDASFVTSMIFLGLIFGAPALGWLSDKWSLRKLPMIIGALVSIVVACAIILPQHLDLHVLEVLFFVLGFVTAAQVISYPLIAESNPGKFIGAAEGLAATIIMAGGLMQPVFAWVLQWSWHGQYAGHLPVYSAADYVTAMWIIPVAFLVALLISLCLKETHAKSFSSSEH